MAALDAAIQEKKLKHFELLMDGRVKPGHDNGESIKTHRLNAFRVQRAC
jgi:hypothetical protein